MTCAELIKYLSQFEPEKKIGVGAFAKGDPLIYRVSGYTLAATSPVLMFEINSVSRRFYSGRQQEGY